MFSRIVRFLDTWHEAQSFLGHIFCLKDILGSSLFLELFSFFVRNILQKFFSEMFYHFLKIHILGGASRTFPKFAENPKTIPLPLSANKTLYSPLVDGQLKETIILLSL